MQQTEAIRYNWCNLSGRHYYFILCSISTSRGVVLKPHLWRNKVLIELSDCTTEDLESKFTDITNSEMEVTMKNIVLASSVLGLKA